VDTWIGAEEDGVVETEMTAVEPGTVVVGGGAVTVFETGTMTEE
jgi:hypothetical protein